MAEAIQNRRDIISKRYGNRWKQFLEKIKGGLNYSLVFTIITHVAMLVIGSINISNCPVEDNIPIFLVVTGVVGIISKVVTIARNILLRYIRVSPILSTAGLIEFVMFICGSVWVYKVFEPSYVPSDGKLYCNKTAYLFTFIYITCIYVILLPCLLLMCCICAIVCIAASVDDNADDKEANQDASSVPMTAKQNTQDC